MSKKLRLLSFVMMILILAVSLPMYAFAMGIDAADETEEIKINYETEVIEEKESLRDENIKHYLLSDGTTKAVVYPTPVHYLDENGEWADIDNTLSLISNEYTSNNKFEIKFAKKSGSSNLLSIKDGEYKITFTPLNANKVTVEIDNPEKSNSLKFKDVSELSNLKSRVIYENAYDGVDLEYILTGNNIKENLIVNEQLDEYVFEFEIKVKGLELSVNDGCVVFTDSKTLEEKYKIPLPYMYDANGEHSMAVEYSVEQTNNSKYILTIEANNEWINSSSRAFPVTIDPSIILTTGTSVGCVDSNGVNLSSNEMFHVVGTDSDFTDSRIYYKATMPTIPSGAVLTNATAIFVNMEVGSKFNIGAYKVTSNWTPSTLLASYSSVGSLSASPYDIITLSSDSSPAEWDITRIAKEWIDGSTNYGICLKAVSNVGSSGYYAFLSSGNWQYIEGPRIEITYIDTIGLEDYFSYYSSSAFGAGYGYVNSFTGNLTFVHDTFSTVDEILPYTVSLVYNSQKGNWITSYSESIQQVTLPDGNVVYKWIDSDGTSHLLSRIRIVNADGTYSYYDYTKSGSLTSTTTGKYYDTEGLGLTLEISGSNYILSDQTDNKKTFNSAGKLANITDKYGNVRTFNYGGNGQVSTITLTPKSSSSAITQIMLEYNTDGTLKQIINCQTDIYATLSYSSSLIAGIEYYYSSTDKYNVAFTYSGTNLTVAKDSKAMKGMKYGYTSGKVTSVTELAYSSSTASVNGNSATISYGTGSTTYRSSGADKSSTSDDILTVYRFDYKGRVITAYSTDSTGKTIYGSTNFVYNDMYTDGESTVKTNNSIKSVVQSNSTTPNRLKNTDFETGIGNWITVGSVSTATASDGEDDPLIYGNSVWMYGTSSSKHSIAQSVYLESGTYTFSLSMMKDKMSSSSNVVFKVSNNTGSVIKTSPQIKRFDSTNSNITDYWEREFLTFDVTTSGTYTVLVEYTPTSSSEYIYIDDIMLEKSKGMGTYSSYENGDFEQGILSSNCVNASRTSGKGITGSYGIVLTSTPTTQARYKYTHTSYTGWVEDKWIVSAWGKSTSAVASSNKSNSPSVFGIKIVAHYTGTTETYETIVPFNSENKDWQYVSETLNIPILNYEDATSGKLDTIDIYLCYDNNVGTAQFDRVSITRAGTCLDYTYNGLGNIQSVSSSDGTKTEYQYASNNAVDPTGVVDSNGREYSVDNTSTHDVSSITYNGKDGNESGKLTTDYDYSTQGQITASVMSASDSSKLILTTSSYYTSTSLSYYSKVNTVTDERGNVTRYFYYDNGLLKGITGPDNKGMIYTYNSYGQLVYAEPAKYSSGSIVRDTTLSANVDYSYNNKLELNQISTNTVDYTFEYDVYGNITGIKADNVSVISYEYLSNNGNLDKMTYGNNAYVEYTYDELDRIIGVCYNGIESAVYVYSPNGQVATVEDKVNGLTYAYYYTGEGNIAQERVIRDNETIYSVLFKYDEQNRITSKSTYFLDTNTYPVHLVMYEYDDDGNISKITNSTGTSENYVYDNFGRLTSNTLKASSNAIMTDTYSYLDKDNYYTTSYISSVSTTVGSSTFNISYSYDENGNITLITYQNGSATYKTSYVYDGLGQLTRENNQLLGKTYLYSYDNAGNITSKKTYSYTTGTVGTVLTTDTYSYGSDDKMTAVNGNSVTYDAIGNPLSYYNGSRYTFTWQNGRELASAVKGSTNVTYKYDTDGIRLSKVVNGILHEYVLEGTTIIRELIHTGSTSTSSVSKDIRYFYDAGGNISSARVVYSGTVYDYIFRTNVQGDVLGVYNKSGTALVSYAYDAWGNFTETVHSTTTEATLASDLPFRYRGYYYDEEIGLYYLNTRYYDAKLHRFLNIDNVAVIGATPGDLTDKNLYAYCDNNPVMRSDDGGQFWDTLFDVVSLVTSVVEVVAKPYDPWAWAGLVGDAIDLIPFVTGVGETTRAINVTRKVVDKADDVVDAAKDVYRTADAASDIKKATGSYEIIYESGKNYVGKGGFDRAIKSAEIHSMDNTGTIVDKVVDIRWRSAPDKNSAFISEYLMQKKNGVGLSNELTYNKIWSPGRKYFGDMFK